MCSPNYVAPQLERLAPRSAGLLQQIRPQLRREELVVQALVDQVRSRAAADADLYARQVREALAQLRAQALSQEPQGDWQS